MSWNPINTCNLIASLIMLVSVLAVHYLKQEEIVPLNRTEQILLGLSTVLMFVPLTMTHLEFGFSSVEMMLIWLAGSLLCLIVFDADCVFMIMKGCGRKSMMTGLIAQSVLYLLSGALLRHPLLLVSGAAYFIVRLNHILTETEKENL